MRMRIDFSVDNSAFDVNPGNEIKYVLQKILDKLDHGKTEGNARDSSGTIIGTWGLRRK